MSNWAREYWIPSWFRVGCADREKCLGVKHFNKYFEKVYTQDQLADVIRLALGAPDTLVPSFQPVVERVVSEKSMALDVKKLSQGDYKYFFDTVFESERLAGMDTVNNELKTKLLAIAEKDVQDGLFHNVPSLKWIHLLLSSDKLKVPFLSRPLISDLKKSLDAVPHRFFHNLQQSIGTDDMDKFLRPYRKGGTSQIVNDIASSELKDHVVCAANEWKRLAQNTARAER